MSSLAGCANLDHGLRVALVVEEAARRHDDGVLFSDNLGAGRDLERAGDAVDTGVKVDDLASSGGAVDDALQGGGIIRDGIT